MKFVQLLKSRKFWATVIALAFVIILAIDPNFPLEEEQVVSVVALLASYVIGVGIEGGWQDFGDVPGKLVGLLSSRKFWAALVGFVVTVSSSIFPDFPVTADELLPIVLSLVAFITGTAIEDRVKMTNGQ